MRSLNLLPVFLFAAILFAGCQKTEHPSETMKELSEKKEIHFTKELQESSELTTAKAERKKIISNIEVYGALSQDTENTVHIASKESGILKVSPSFSTPPARWPGPSWRDRKSVV